MPGWDGEWLVVDLQLCLGCACGKGHVDVEGKSLGGPKSGAVRAGGSIG